MPDIPYTFKALFAVVRIALWFWLLFAVIAPWFFRHIRELPQIEKMIYAWVGLGGIIIASVFLLTVLHIYDFISIVLTLLLIPLVLHFMRQEKVGIKQYVREFELRSIVKQIEFIENYDGFSWQKLTSSARKWIREENGLTSMQCWLYWSPWLVGSPECIRPCKMPLHSAGYGTCI
ncbi:MAG: hypothetical protein U5K69_20655 [Balneolaceae bacterium]|nr:hypothetical protein [Balneolaceae bacterium]